MSRHACVVGAFMAAASLVAADHGSLDQRAGVFSARVEAVRVDVLVTDRGKAVKGLEAGDFLVSDNGVPQTVELISFDQVPLSVVLALDISSSLTEDRLEQLRGAGVMLLDDLKPQDQAALITFTEAVTRPQAPPPWEGEWGAGLTADLRRVRAALAATLPPGGTRATSLADAVFSALVVAGSDVGRSLVVAFSDGVDTTSWLQPAEVLDVARRSDAVAYAVATRHEGRSSFLADLTAVTSGSLIEVESTKDLGSAFVAVLNEFRQRYLVSYTPQGVAKGGWHNLSVRVKGRNVKIKARPGYWADR